jgi:lipid-binding SYLF domain-containing protein
MFGQLDDKVADRLWQASNILDELMQAPDGGIPYELLKRAECVAVIPGVKKAALGFGGRYGRGVAACRTGEGKGAWGAPSMIALGGGSFGLQLGGSSTDIVMLFMTPNSMEHLLNDKVTLGGDISVAAGPKGRHAAAGTSATMRAEILTYARSRGVFAGVALNGGVLQPDTDANRVLYQRRIEGREILVGGAIAIPEPARKFVETLARAASAN